MCRRFSGLGAGLFCLRGGMLQRVAIADAVLDERITWTTKPKLVVIAELHAADNVNTADNINAADSMIDVLAKASNKAKWSFLA